MFEDLKTHNKSQIELSLDKFHVKDKHFSRLPDKKRNWFFSTETQTDVLPRYMIAKLPRKGCFQAQTHKFRTNRGQQCLDSPQNPCTWNSRSWRSLLAPGLHGSLTAAAAAPISGESFFMAPPRSSSAAVSRRNGKFLPSAFFALPSPISVNLTVSLSTAIEKHF